MQTVEIIFCPLCTAKGTLECVACNGTGKVLNPSKMFASNNHEPTLIFCNICTGTGRLMCSYCRGTGKILTQK